MTNSKSNRKIYFLLILIFFTVSLFAQLRVGQSKMQYMLIGVDTRATGMGEAYTAMVGESGSVFYNPASLAFTNGLSASFYLNEWLVETNIYNTLLTYNAGNIGAFSFFALIVDHGDILETTFDDNVTNPLGYNIEGTFNVNQNLFGLGYAKKITNRLSLGGQIKFAYENLGTFNNVKKRYYSEIDIATGLYDGVDEAKQSLVLFDIGSYYDFEYKGLKIGMAIQNFANEPMPMTFRFGIVGDLNQIFFSKIKKQRLTLSTDVLHHRDYGARLHTGLEYAFNERFFVRSGYKFNYDLEDISVGLGAYLFVQEYEFNFNYSFVRVGVFGYINRFSIQIQL